MQNQLIIYINANKLCHLDGSEMDADALKMQAVDQKIIVLVPATDVLLSTVNLPKMSRSRLRAALPFALEEQLIGELESLHIVPGTILADGRWSVAVVAHEKMQTWLALLKSCQINPDVLMPISLALPYRENTWSVFAKEQTVVRINNHLGFGCDNENLATMLGLAQQDLVAKPVIEHLPHDAETMIKIQEEAAQSHLFNLLQNEYAVKKSPFAAIAKINKIMLYLAMSWLGLLFLYPTVSNFMLTTHLNNIDDEIKEIYQRQFPQSSNVVAPKLRMEEKWQRLSASVGENKLFILLGHVGQAMKMNQGMNLKRFEFDHHQLMLEVMASSSEELTAFTDFLERQGLKVKQQNATLAGARMNASIIIE